MMRTDILYVVANLQCGGLERLVTDWALALHPAHASCAVLCIDSRTGPLVATLEDHGVAVHELRQKTMGGVVFTRRFSALVRQLGPRVVHSQCHWSLAHQALAVRLAGVRNFILTIHNTYPRQGRPAEWRRRASTALARPWVSHVVAVSEEVRRHSCALFGLPPDRIATIYNGIDTARFHPAATDGEKRDWRQRLGLPPRGALVLNVAAHSRQKDQLTLLRAFARLESEALLALVGDGPLRPALEAAARDLGIADRVRFLGTRQDVPEILRAADVFVLSSRWEGLPLALAEAMASGLPVVATRVGGNGELVTSGHDGVLVAPEAPDALGDALRNVLREPARMAAMGAAGRQTVCERFSRETCLSGYRRLYGL